MTKEQIQELENAGFKFEKSGWEHPHNGDIHYEIRVIAPDKTKFWFLAEEPEDIDGGEFIQRYESQVVSDLTKKYKMEWESILRKELEKRVKSDDSLELEDIVFDLFKGV